MMELRMCIPKCDTYLQMHIKLRAASFTAIPRHQHTSLMERDVTYQLTKAQTGCKWSLKWAQL